MGLRFDNTTRYATIDLDLEGDYHNIESINRIKAALEDIGIVDIIILQSSFSGGYHLILSFTSPLPTFPHAQGNLRVLKPLWLAWVGEEMPPVEEVWRLYLRRFTIDHWYRFLKQRLHWTVPKLSTPKQCERWSDLMPLMTWELWLARDIVTDNPLPSPKGRG